MVADFASKETGKKETLSDNFLIRIKIKLGLNAWMYSGVGGGWIPHKVFLSFFLGDKTSAPDVFSSCLFIPRAHFEASSVMISCCGYEI